MSIGPDIKEVLTEVGTAYTIIRSAGNVAGEYLDYELNAQVTKPFIQEFFLDASLSYNTALIAGDILEFNVAGTRYLLMNKTPETFENEVISYAAVLYKSNVNNEGFVLDIICGGASAPHAKYVEYPRPGFPGYFFMLAGKDYGAKRIGPIIKEEVRNEFNI